MKDSEVTNDGDDLPKESERDEEGKESVRKVKMIKERRRE